MKPSKPNVTVIGRRLRRYLGALLAVGFGMAWWRFVPPAEAHAEGVVSEAPPATGPKPDAPPVATAARPPIHAAAPAHVRPRFAQPPPVHARRRREVAATTVV